jgi:hypothetical protein
MPAVTHIELTAEGQYRRHAPDRTLSPPLRPSVEVFVQGSIMGGRRLRRDPGVPSPVPGASVRAQITSWPALPQCLHHRQWKVLIPE